MRLAAQPPKMASVPGSVDTSNIVSVCRNGDAVDRALLKEMLGYFIGENRRRLIDAAQAVESQNREALRQVAHAIRGSAAMLGAGHLRDLAGYLESEAASADITQLQVAVDAMGSEFSEVLTALRGAHPEALGD